MSTVTVYETKNIISINQRTNAVTVIENVNKIIISGIRGIDGEKGDTGATGAQGLKGDKGDNGADGNDNLFIQSIAPTVTNGIPYLWINTTGGNLQFMIEDGL